MNHEYSKHIYTVLYFYYLLLQAIINTVTDIEIRLPLQSFRSFVRSFSLSRAVALTHARHYFSYNIVAVTTANTVTMVIITDRDDAAELLLYSFNASLYSTAAIRTHDVGASVATVVLSSITSGLARLDRCSVAQVSGTVVQQSK